MVEAKSLLNQQNDYVKSNLWGVTVTQIIVHTNGVIGRTNCLGFESMKVC